MNTKPTEFKLLKGAAIYGVYKHTMKKLTKPVKVKSRRTHTKSVGDILIGIVAFIILGMIVSR